MKFIHKLLCLIGWHGPDVMGYGSYLRSSRTEPKRKDQSLRDLLAIIHRDGGHHTAAVGIEQSIKDAQAAVCELKRELAMAKREPLSDSDADYWLRNRQAILDAIRREGFVLMSNACGFWLKRMDKVSEAHGIGGSDGN